MATPANITLENLDDQWAMNFGLCDNSDPMLKLHGVPWLLRKILGWVSMTVAIKTWSDTPTGLTHFLIEYKPPLGLPTSSEERVFNFEGDEFTVPIYGKLRVRMRWATAKELDGIDEFLAEGFEGTNIHMMTEHVDLDTVTHQVFGFEEVGGTRFHTRHIVVMRGEEVQKLRLVYDYIGPRPSKS
ncbi:hypothetical protein F5B21DRAFT_484964 [Xylaria acuta]|nr:hypothetical protein F5B21DRAFT_484964 [Xylaria acuta]